LQSDKREAYRCLISLPKSAVSELAKTLNVMKRVSDMDDIEVDEMCGQEENMLKLFSTAAAADHTISDYWWKVIANILLAGSNLVCLIVIASSGCPRRSRTTSAIRTQAT
jgi:hypothetical protein